jgi:protein involved in polysaccharide export with SLBB domain
MNRFTLALFVMIFAMVSSAAAQSKAAVSGAQASEWMLTASSSAVSRAQTLTSVPTSDSVVESTDAAKTPPPTGAAAGATTPAPVLNQIYRVGIGDVLDVRLIDLPTSKSTLFTVLPGGLLDHPLSNAPIPVAGLTTIEVAIQLCKHIKVLDNPKVSVTVRDYSSHSVIITGAVTDPGVRFLRREATPLYVLLAEAQPRTNAASAIITRNESPALNINLKDQASLATLVLPGDTIKIMAAPSQAPAYFYAGGALNAPGQKSFHKGLTLTQAIIASGGVTRLAGSTVKIMRQGEDGRLATTEYNLPQIEEGKTPDPVLKEGDRITVSEGH